jgi:multiple sugar transport system ATP-binding protein
MSEIILDRVSKVYPDGFRAIEDMSLRVSDGETFVLLGPSGCGKSTLLRMMAGLEEITSGVLTIDGQVANHLPARDRNIAMVFQSGALYPHLTVRGNLAFPLKLAGVDRAIIDERIVDLSRALAIEETLDRLPDTLSGGQRQRVAMGRAIIRQPSAFLMDEPLSNLDAALRTELRMEIGALVRSIGATTVYVTHDQVEALTLADRIAIMKNGVLQDLGTPEQVYDDPGTVFVAAFLSAPQLNLLAATVWLVEGESIVLDFGTQSLRLPWTDHRAADLTSHHGSSVTVGIRPDTLTPTSDGAEGTVLSGRLRSLEYHGHEWLAHVEAGLATVEVEPHHDDEVLDEPPAKKPPLRRLLRNVGLGSVHEETPARHTKSGTHRRADLVFRAPAPRGLNRGDQVHLSVDTDRMLLFGKDGRRVDRVRR